MKIVINGETFDWDGEHRPMSEALAIEDVYQRRYVEWQADIIGGSARAMCVLVWLIWRRDGRDVPYEHIIDGTVAVDVEELMLSMITAATDAAAAAGERAPDPTAAGTPPDPDGTPSTVIATSGFSRSTSGSARGKSKG